MSSFSHLGNIYERYQRYSPLNCCSGVLVWTNDRLRCQKCPVTVTFQNFVLSLPPPASCEAGREYFNVTGERNVLVRVPIIYLEDKPIIINLELDVFEKVFRLYAMLSSNFVDRNQVPCEMRDIMEARGTVEYDEAITYFDETLNMSVKDVGSLKLTGGLFSMYKQLFAEFKTSMKTGRLDPVDLLESKLLPIYFVISDTKTLEKVKVLKDMKLATDWFHFFQETLCQARMTVSRYAATIDLVLSMIPLVVIMQHKEQKEQKSSDIVFGRILSSSVSLAEMTEAECSLTSERIQQLVFSFMGFQLYRLTTGFYDSSFIKTNIFQTALATVRRYCSLRNNKTHDSKYRFLVRNLTDPQTDPDEKMVENISQLYGAVKHEINSIIRRQDFWTHVLGKQLTDEQKTLFQLFGVPERPESEEDNVKYISALNIASSSTLYLRIMKVVSSVFSSGLPFVIKFSCRALASRFTTDPEEAARFIKMVDEQLEGLSFSPNDSKELTNEVISYKARQCFENVKKNRGVEVKTVSPYLSMFSRILERLASFGERLLVSNNLT
ncbi:hypothetical protein HDE_00932 [Halotydeus destructor]|nr:hypothetical protein HDE_00932 [Halotydeus destructor]